MSSAILPGADCRSTRFASLSVKMIANHEQPSRTAAAFSIRQRRRIAVFELRQQPHIKIEQVVLSNWAILTVYSLERA
jgi:hypothetical protein